MDIKQIFIWKHVVDAQVENMFVQSEEKKTDVSRINMGTSACEKHSNKLKINERMKLDNFLFINGKGFYF